MTIHKCETCPYWEKNALGFTGPIALDAAGKAPKFGACHLYPPRTVLLGQNAQTNFPITTSETWCAQHPKNKTESV